jgi:hypothetical protein
MEKDLIDDSNHVSNVLHQRGQLDFPCDTDVRWKIFGRITKGFCDGIEPSQLVVLSMWSRFC